MSSPLEDRLRDALSAAGPESSDFDLNPDITLPANRRLRPAAVLIAVVDHGDQARLILTKRSSALKHHPGQIAFPGGKLDAGDASLEACALREAQEETGLDPAAARILGCLPSHETVTGFEVTPVLAMIGPDITLTPELGEVAEVFSVPFFHVTEPGNFRIEGRIWKGQRRQYFTVPYGPYYIWGATARILRGLGDRLRA